MAECHNHCPSPFDVPNEDNCKERVGRDVGMSNIAVIMDEGTSFGASDKETLLQGFGPKNKGNQYSIVVVVLEKLLANEDKALSLQVQINSLGWVVNLSNPKGFCR